MNQYSALLFSCFGPTAVPQFEARPRHLRVAEQCARLDSSYCILRIVKLAYSLGFDEMRSK
jgi:hypothetical protein